MSRSTPVLLALAIAVGAIFTCGCEDKKPSSDSPRADAAGADKYASADPKLEKALKAAASASPPGDNGPPPDGVFAPGAADRRHPADMPTKVELVSEGSEPRIAMGSASDGGVSESARGSSYGPAAMEIGIQMGPRAALPTIDLSLTIGPAKADEGGPGWIDASVRKAVAAKDQFGSLPADSERAIGSLEGTAVLLQLAADGRAGALQTRLGKSTNPELERVARSAAETLLLATVPVPGKPVGVGAQWLAETRMSWLGVDVIAYRAFHVASVTGNRLRLTVDIRAYATGKGTQLQGVPKDATLEQFEGEAKGEMEVVSGELLARRSDMQERVLLVFASDAAGNGAQAQPGRPDRNMLTAQIQSQASFFRGDDLRALEAKGDTRR